MTHEKTIIEHAINGLESISENSTYGSDLHHELFNTDYFIIGYYYAEQWINQVGGAFSVIRAIRDYETFNFGECSTNLSSSESVANMYAYILGESLLNDLETLKDKWDDKLTDEDLQAIKEELSEML
jgi:hypothetical protein